MPEELSDLSGTFDGGCFLLLPFKQRLSLSQGFSVIQRFSGVNGIPWRLSRPLEPA